jgi:undecaprenyl-diphosphatase
MSWLQVVVLAIVQGLTEFLPISSSGHLVLVPKLFGWADQGLAYDVAVHFGSLGAVVLFFRNDIAGLLRGGIQVLRARVETIEARLALGIALGTIPAAVVGLLLAGWIEEHLRSPMVIVFTLAGYAILMAVADLYGRRSRQIASVGIRDAFLIGCAQALALVPGTSRSGVTITAGLALGLERQDAARFSFLLVVPVILLASVYEFSGLLETTAPVAWTQLGVAALISAVVSYLSIDFLMRFVTRIGLVPFAVYRLVLASVIVVIHYGLG